MTGGPPFIARAAAIGIVAGLRSQVPLALIAGAARLATGSGLRPPFDRLTTRSTTAALGISAAGEIVVDKLPVVPNRLQPGPLAGRLLFGALAAAALADLAGATRGPAALAGAAGAAVGSVVGRQWRVGVAEQTDLPDFIPAVIEDAAALALGAAIVGANPSPLNNSSARRGERAVWRARP